MPLGRYSTLAYSDPNQMPLVSLPFEAMDQVLAGYQQSKDTYEAVEGMGFNYLRESPSDVALAAQVRNYQKDLTSQVAEVARSGDIAKYQQALKTGIRQMADLRTPGGPIYALEQRVKQMAQARTELKERYDKLTDVNYDYALAQLQPGDIGYNLDTGDFQQITAPTIQDFVDVQKLIRETAKAMVPAEETISYIDGDYVWTKSGKKYYIAEAVQNMLNSPEIAEQMKINSWYRLNQLSPQQKQNMLRAAQDAAYQNLETLHIADESLQQLSNSSSSSDIKDLQNVLKELGFDPGPADGIIGKRTSAALNQARNFINEETDNMKLNYGAEDLMGLMYNELKDTYLNYGRALRPDSYSRKIQMANWRARLRAQRASQQSLLEQFAVATQADLFPVALPASDFDPGKLESQAVEAVQEAEYSANAELNKFKANGIFAESETLDGVVQKWKSLNDLKKEDPENYRRNFAQIYTDGDIDKANRMIQTIEFDNKGMIPALRERARLKKTVDMISAENQVARQSFAEREGEDIIRDAWDYVNKVAAEGKVLESETDYLGMTGPLKDFQQQPGLKQVPIDISSQLKGYNYEQFRDEFLSNPDGVPILGSRGKGDVIRKRFSKSMKEDMGRNEEVYRSQINYGIKGDSEILKRVTDVVGQVEASGYFINNASQDPLGNPAVYMRDGREVEVDMNGKADVTMSVVAGEPVFVFSRRTADGENTARMTVMPSDVLGQNEYMEERILELAAEAFNNENINDIISLLPFIEEEDPLEAWADETVSPEAEGRIGNIVIRDENGSINQPVELGTRYSVLDTDSNTGISAITARTRNGNKKYFVGRIDDKGNVNLVPDLSGDVGLPLPTASSAKNVVKYNKLRNNPKLLQVLRNFRDKPLTTVAPERRGEVMNIINMFGNE